MVAPFAIRYSVVHSAKSAQNRCAQPVHNLYTNRTPLSPSIYCGGFGNDGRAIENSFKIVSDFRIKCVAHNLVDFSYVLDGRYADKAAVGVFLSASKSCRRFVE